MYKSNVELMWGFFSLNLNMTPREISGPGKNAEIDLHRKA